MKLATTTGDFLSYTNSQTESMRHIRESGFKFADYSFIFDYILKCGFYSDDTEKHLEDILSTADRLSVKFVQSHAPMGKPLKDGGVNTEFAADTIKSVESCAKLGIDRIVVHSGYEQGISKNECLLRNREFFLRVLETAEKYNINILVENFNKMHIEDMYWIDNAEDLREMIELVNHPLFHACWDAGHGNMQEMPQDEALRILGKHVFALHVQDNMGDKDSHAAPFFGTLNLDSLMHGLMDIGYNGYFTFEANFFLSSGRRAFPKDERLLRAPLELRIEAEKLLYKTGQCILSAYDCFEE